MAAIGSDPGETLETGFLPSTPNGDNALFDYARGETDSFAALALSAGGRVHRDAALGISLADSGVPTPFGNTVHITKPVGDDAITAFVGTLHDFFGT